MVGVMRPVLAMLYTDHRLIPAARARAFTDAARRWFRRRFELYLIDLTARRMSFSLSMGWSTGLGLWYGPDRPPFEGCSDSTEWFYCVASISTLHTDRHQYCPRDAGSKYYLLICRGAATTCRRRLQPARQSCNVHTRSTGGGAWPPPKRLTPTCSPSGTAR